MPDISQPSPVDPVTGDILVHGRGGLKIPFQIGVPAQDISALALFFEVDGKLRKALDAGPDAETRLLVLTDTEIAALELHASPSFCVRNETADPVDVPWAGKVRLWGFQGQPS